MWLCVAWFGEIMAVFVVCLEMVEMDDKILEGLRRVTCLRLGCLEFHGGSIRFVSCYFYLLSKLLCSSPTSQLVAAAKKLGAADKDKD